MFRILRAGRRTSTRCWRARQQPRAAMGLSGRCADVNVINGADGIQQVRLCRPVPQPCAVTGVKPEPATPATAHHRGPSPSDGTPLGFRPERATPVVAHRWGWRTQRSGRWPTAEAPGHRSQHHWPRTPRPSQPNLRQAPRAPVTFVTEGWSGRTHRLRPCGRDDRRSSAQLQPPAQQTGRHSCRWFALSSARSWGWQFWSEARR